jgi:hypothetical protein
MKKHAGSGKPQGVLNRGTTPQPSPLHGGTSLRKGTVHDAAAPKPSQRSTSWHAMAAARLKRKY